MLLNQLKSQSISVGDFHTCVVESDNNAYCWGYDGNGQLGNNSTVQSLSPVPVNTSGVLAGKTILAIFLFKLLNSDIEDLNLKEFGEDEKLYTKDKDNWKRYHSACKAINEKVREATDNKIKQFLIFNSTITGKVRINPEYLRVL